MLSDGDTFSLTLDVSDIYQVETGVASTIYIRITEGDGSRYVLSETIDISLVPRGGDSEEGSSGGPQFDNLLALAGPYSSDTSSRGNFGTPRTIQGRPLRLTPSNGSVEWRQWTRSRRMFSKW